MRFTEAPAACMPACQLGTVSTIWCVGAVVSRQRTELGPTHYQLQAAGLYASSIKSN